jgi:hypothetical protein
MGVPELGDRTLTSDGQDEAMRSRFGALAQLVE